MTSFSTAIQYRQVVKEFTGDWTGRRWRALDNVSLDVDRGCITALVGPNGSGKSTMLKLAAGLTRPTAGSCRVFGRVGYLPESAVLPDFMTALQVLEAVGALENRALPPSEMRRVLHAVQLEDAADRRVAAFSKGMRQRLGLAVAMLGAPDILLLDEPGDGLDPRATVRFQDLLRAERDAGRTVVVASHFLPAIEEIADQVAVLEAGRIVFAGTRQDVRQRGGLTRLYLETATR